jgi:hypothetical protein
MPTPTEESGGSPFFSQHSHEDLPLIRLASAAPVLLKRRNYFLQSCRNYGWLIGAPCIVVFELASGANANSKAFIVCLIVSAELATEVRTTPLRGKEYPSIPGKGADGNLPAQPNEEDHAMQKFLVCASLAGLLLLAGASTWMHSVSAQNQPADQPQATKTIAGTVTSIGSDGHSFGLEVDQNGQKQTMQFVVGKNAKIQGQVKVGTPVTVEYAMEGGQNLALTITAQG